MTTIVNKFQSNSITKRNVNYKLLRNVILLQIAS